MISVILHSVSTGYRRAEDVDQAAPWQCAASRGSVRRSDSKGRIGAADLKIHFQPTPTRPKTKTSRSHLKIVEKLTEIYAEDSI
jgi:hypothetical protein